MGAFSFQARSKDPSPDKAYKDLVSEALYSHGRDSYNGTISTTSGFRVVSQTPVSALDAERIAGERLGGLSKWGVCEAIAVGVCPTIRERVVTLTLRPESPRTDVFELDRGLVAGRLDVPVSALEKLEIVESTPRYRYKVHRAGPASRVWSTSAGGSFATRAEAIGYARQRLASGVFDTGSGVTADDRVEVFQRTVRSPEAAIERILVSWKVKVKVRVADGDRVFDHWLFYGWAAS